jgi:hypothetical protein
LLRGNSIEEKKMKFGVLLSILVVLLLFGCRYESPLQERHTLPVDASVLGVWKAFPDEGEEPVGDERMIVLKYSDTEYLIHYDAKNDEMYYRGYPIRVGDVSCIQVQIIGTNQGPPKKSIKDLFHVVSYNVTDGVLEVRSLNTYLVDDDLKDPQALKEAFLRHKDDKNLFIDPGRFKRVEDPSE